ncbi:hypothetical protein [Methanimicrococcus blatticola]|uniref:Uncharacterized protein n=1 Tax=Methanimicrococcus blatticola TaxID=91560 RepID=A0A484F248_9EURY|nr:hypothetical protein [Methanimicrococcus blatticola]MBZ3936348.1 hypothetical protein [Methanimicrococcus blatticola]MCC2509510.1 hypothetical protein [Methanimicrococcus blatticola]TDQ67563.1 hypothetical protein C7391_1534 [Methanimicrococcus blatticola]
MKQILDAISGINEVLDAYVWLGIPDVVKGIVLAFLFAVIFKKYIKKYPLIFYIYPILLCIWFTFTGLTGLFNLNIISELGMNNWWIITLIRFPYSLGVVTPLGIGLITIVMFIGVLPKSKTVIELYKIRAELSIIGATLLVAHGMMRIGRASNSFSSFLDGEFSLRILAFAIIGPIILLLIILPWLTSFPVIRKRLKPKTWKVLQTYTCVPMFIGMLLFGWAFTAGASISTYPDLMHLSDIVINGRGNPISLNDGINFANSILGSKVYLALLAAYLWLRYRRSQERKKKAIKSAN